MNPVYTLVILLAYFALLILIANLTSQKDDHNAFFLGSKQSPWYVVAFGMIGASLSGVTFISVPGWVGSSGFSYMQMVLGYLLGYSVIALVLMPVYYKLNLTSIYTYLEQRFGFYSYKTGAVFFLISRVIGASFRLYLVAIVLQTQVIERLGWNVPFVFTVFFTISLIWLYTFQGGIKTIIWTDTLQTFCMLVAVGVAIWGLGQYFNKSFFELGEMLWSSSYSKAFHFSDWKAPNHFFKQFISGAFIAIVMTGLDQDMMQKNLSCRNLKEAKINMFSFAVVLVFVNLIFLMLGGLLFLFAQDIGLSVPEKTDLLFPMIAMDGYLGVGVAVFFVLGLIASAYSSADSALTALTTSFCVDILNFESRSDASKKKTRWLVHIMMSCVLLSVICIFKTINNENVVKELFIYAGYTYGPLLGMYAFGLFNKRVLNDPLMPFIAVVAPLLTALFKYYGKELFGYDMGFELLLLNGAFTFNGMFIFSKKVEHKKDISLI
jgi:Na+/proline symporter